MIWKLMEKYHRILMFYKNETRTQKNSYILEHLVNCEENKLREHSTFVHKGNSINEKGR